MEKTTLKILHVENHPVCLAGVKCLLEAGIPDTEVHAAETAHEALELCWKKKWNLVIMDIAMPGRGGLDLIKDIREAAKGTPILVLSAHDESVYGLRMLRLGALGYLRKDVNALEMVLAAKTAIAGQKYISNRLASELANHLVSDTDGPPHELLSEREFQTLTMLGSGKSIKEIGAKLNLSVKTISTYRMRVLKKLNAEHNAHLVSYCITHNLTDGEFSSNYWKNSVNGAA